MTAFASLGRGQRCWAVVVISALPCFVGGHLVGQWSSALDLDNPSLGIVERALACAAPAALIGACLPRYWLVPAMLYSYAFACSYEINETFCVLPRIFLASWALLDGQRLAPTPEHRELPWLLGFAMWAAAFAALLTHRFRRVDTTTTRHFEP